MNRLGMSIRLKLALIYGGLFLLTGAALLAVNYGLVSKNLPRFAVQRTPVEGAQEDFILPAPAFEEPVDASGRRLIEVIRDAEERYRRQVLNELLVQSGIALAAMAFVSVGLGWAVAGKVLRPLHDITATARRLSDQTLHERIRMQGPDDELKELADTFDGMLERLDSAFDSQRRFVANASHEIKTPLSIIRTEIDVALRDPGASSEDLREMAERVRSAVDRSDRLIESLLVLARSQRSLSVRDPVDIPELVRDAILRLQTQADRRNIAITADLEGAVVWGDRTLLERLVANLFENALNYNHEGGAVHVQVSVEGKRAVLDISNTGEALHDADLSRIFEPFRRLGSDRVGSARGAGLGLSIVRAVAEAHGGDVTASARQDGGLKVEVVLPHG